MCSSGVGHAGLCVGYRTGIGEEVKRPVNSDPKRQMPTLVGGGISIYLIFELKFHCHTSGTEPYLNIVDFIYYAEREAMHFYCATCLAFLSVLATLSPNYFFALSQPSS